MITEATIRYTFCSSTFLLACLELGQVLRRKRERRCLGSDRLLTVRPERHAQQLDTDTYGLWIEESA